MRLRRTKVDPQALAQQLSALSETPLDELKQRWRDLYGTAPPARLGRALLTRAIAHRLQEEAFGGLRPVTARLLERVAQDSAVPKRSAAPAIKPGTRLLREWQGETHAVMVRKDGVDYRGVAYRSLSEVARLITGTRWSGPRFFGLTRADK